MIGVRFPKVVRAKIDVGIRVSEQTEKKMCLEKKLQSEIKKAIGGEKKRRKMCRGKRKGKK